MLEQVVAGQALVTFSPVFSADLESTAPRRETHQKNGVRELNLSVPARLVRVKFAVTDVNVRSAQRGEADRAGIQGRVSTAGASCWHEQRGRRRLCRPALEISDLLDSDGDVRRKVVDRESCDTVGDGRTEEPNPCMQLTLKPARKVELPE